MKHFNLNDLDYSINKRGVSAATLVDHDHATIKNLFLNPGDEIPPHKVPVDVTFFILAGKGSITIGKETESVEIFDTILCPQNTYMSVKAEKDSHLSFLNIKTPGLKSK
ncbi:MAG: cupin domain-containing protein [Candidatus Izimaplasma sp.]|nr:cupin domain-containing protein [Candidatus Izimaplasma bacterium]